MRERPTDGQIERERERGDTERPIIHPQAMCTDPAAIVLLLPQIVSFLFRQYTRREAKRRNLGFEKEHFFWGPQNTLLCHARQATSAGRPVTHPGSAIHSPADLFSVHEEGVVLSPAPSFSSPGSGTKSQQGSGGTIRRSDQEEGSGVVMRKSDEEE